MKSRKNRTALLVLCCIAVFSALLPIPTYGQQLTFFKPLGGKVFPRWDTICIGLDLAFDVETPEGKTEGPFAVTPLTDRNRWYTIIGIPGKNILLTAVRFKVPLCISPCKTDCCVGTPPVCPVSAYAVHTFGVSIMPTIGL